MTLPDTRPVFVSGASGLIGRALAESLTRDGVEVIRLVRRPARTPHEVEWLRGGAALDPEVLAGVRAVVNLNGASIGQLPWTRRYRAVLRDSRLAPTLALAEAVRRLGTEAPHFLSASAVGVYGDRPGERLTEASAPGATFLARLSEDWEGAALTAGPAARVTLLRTASVLHPGAVLRPLIALTRFGLGGPLGDGHQFWPWISLTDEVRAIRHAIDHGLTGPVNLCGPTPATAAEIGRALAHELRRPYLLPAPRWALRLALGRDAADSLLLADARVEPVVLRRSGFAFRHTTAGEAIAASLAG